MNRHTALLSGLLLMLTACGDKPADTQTQNATNGTSTAPTQQTTQTTNSSEPKSAGDVDFPALPIIAAPNFIGTSAAQAKLEIQISPLIKPMSGISVRAAQCGADGGLINERGIFSVDETGGSYTENSDRGIFMLEADGSGTANFAGGIIRVEADGSGTINGSGKDGFDDATISIEADGSGTYNGKYGIISLDGRGGGTWNSEFGIITNNGDGSGTWNGEQGVISINADGSGTWNGEHGLIINNGDGTGLVDGKTVAMTPIPPVPPAGKFPLLKTLKAPTAPCGFVITLGDGVLFDFDKHDIRPDASDILDKLSAALTQVEQIKSIEIGGHTDAKGSDDYNLALSDRRANAVVQALQSRGVTTSMSATGYGESKPVATNEVNGKDNPAGRQLNRRVEIFIRTT
ncbi:OmpA family protein [Neisseria elongata]|uniref:OmpA family protein n=1 Tax=Neisseria elongata TaxID=495 RepID=UPI000D3BF816|nr:OmpA family protein [Neisseria elongata]